MCEVKPRLSGLGVSLPAKGGVDSLFILQNKPHGGVGV